MQYYDDDLTTPLDESALIEKRIDFKVEGEPPLADLSNITIPKVEDRTTVNALAKADKQPDDWKQAETHFAKTAKNELEYRDDFDKDGRVTGRTVFIYFSDNPDTDEDESARTRKTIQYEIKGDADPYVYDAELKEGKKGDPVEPDTEEDRRVSDSYYAEDGRRVYSVNYTRNEITLEDTATSLTVFKYQAGGTTLLDQMDTYLIAGIGPDLGADQLNLKDPSSAIDDDRLISRTFYNATGDRQAYTFNYSEDGIVRSWTLYGYDAEGRMTVTHDYQASAAGASLNIPLHLLAKERTKATFT